MLKNEIVGGVIGALAQIGIPLVEWIAPGNARGATVASGRGPWARTYPEYTLSRSAGGVGLVTAGV